MKLKKPLLSGLAAAAMLVGGLALTSTNVQAGDPDNPPVAADVCVGLTSGKIDVADGNKTITVEAPAGKLIAEYCVKAGSDNSPNVEDATFYRTLDPALALVTFPHPSGKDISHYSYRLVDAPPPPTEVPPTDVPPTDVPPTEVPPTDVPPTDVPPTDVPPTDVPATEVPAPEEAPPVVESEGGTVPPPTEAATTTDPPVAGQGGTVPPTTSPSSLPNTGAGSPGILQIGALLLLAGTAIFFAARRRHPDAAA